MVRDVRAVIAKHHRTSDRSIGLSDVRYLYPHQANPRTLEAVARKLRAPLERVHTEGVERYGNTSTASIPIGYSEPRDREHPAGGYEIDIAFGAGFASGAVLRWV